MMRTDSKHPSPTLLPLLLLLTSILARLICVEAVRCGQRPIAAPGTITGGEPTWPGQFPWHVAVWHRTQQLLATVYACGGFIVGPRAIITAAHCVTAPSGYQMAANELTVRVGLYELLTMARHSQEHPVQRVHRHARFSSGSPHHDLALLALRTLLEFDAFVQPICLPRPADDAVSGHRTVQDGDGVYGVVTGWGLTEGDGLARTLRMSTMPTVSHLQCLASDPPLFAPVLYEGMFCAGWQNGTNVCNGDSGGAFAIQQNGHWTALGIVSFTGQREDNPAQPARCSNESLAGFISIPSYVDWIESIAHSEAIELATKPIESGQKADRISERMCQRYRRGCAEEEEDFSYLASVVSPAPNSSRLLVIDCFAVLISDRFLLAPASCRRVNESPPAPDNGAAPTTPKQFIILESAGQAVDAPIKIFHQHPNFVTNDDDDGDGNDDENEDDEGIPEDQRNLALIELERKVSLVSTCQFACLWTGPSPGADSRSVPDQIFLYSAVNVSGDKSMPARKWTANGRGRAGKPSTGSVCYDELLAPTLMTQEERKEQGEIGRHYRLVGIVLYRTCTKIRFIKVALFLDWIEWIVWQPADVA